MTKYLILLFSAVVFAQQQVSKDIKKDVQLLINSSVEQNWEHVLDLTYPAVFAELTREEVIQQMESSLNNESFRIKMLPNTAADFEYSPIYKKDSAKGDYLFVRHPLKMQMNFMEELDSATLPFFVTVFEKQGFNVDKSLKNGLLISTKNSIIIGLRDKLTDGKWRYVNYDPSPMLNRILDADVLAELVKFKEKGEE